MGFGGSPTSGASVMRIWGSIDRREARRARVYGCCGAVYIASTGPISTMWPRYITRTRSLMNCTTFRSCEMNRWPDQRAGALRLRPHTLAACFAAWLQPSSWPAPHSARTADCMPGCCSWRRSAQAAGLWTITFRVELIARAIAKRTKPHAQRRIKRGLYLVGRVFGGKSSSSFGKSLLPRVGLGFPASFNSCS